MLELSMRTALGELGESLDENTAATLADSLFKLKQLSELLGHC